MIQTHSSAGIAQNPLLNAVFFSCGALETLNYKTIQNENIRSNCRWQNNYL